MFQQKNVFKKLNSVKIFKNFSSNLLLSIFKSLSHFPNQNPQKYLHKRKRKIADGSCKEKPLKHADFLESINEQIIDHLSVHYLSNGLSKTI